MQNLVSTLRFITAHPLTRDDKLAALARFARWQTRSRLRGEIVMPWIDGTKLAVRRGQTGATGNIYCGLHEFAEMAFLLHFLREGDAFVDVGANIGSFTVLASGVAGARTWAVEPDPATVKYLTRNVALNGLNDMVTICPCVAGADEGEILFTTGRDTVNKVATEKDLDVRLVRQRPLDAIVGDANPVMMKLDVEGHEANVLAGAKRTLARSSLEVIETECLAPEVVAILHDAGFERFFYEPFSRALSRQPKSKPDNNALFIRNADFVASRLQEARRVRVLKHLV